MNRSKVIWMASLLVAALVSCCSAAASAAAAIDHKPSSKNSALPIEEKVAEKDVSQRESKTIKSDSSYNSYSQYAPAPAATAAYHAQAPAAQPYPVPSTSYSNPEENTMGFVYYYLPTVEKYYPKAKDLLPYIKRYEPVMSRAWPMVRHAADRTFDLASAIGLTLLVPVLIVSTIGFIGFMIFLFFFPAVSAFGRRRIGRSVGDEDAPEDNDFDHLLPAGQSRTFATLAAKVDRMMETYMRAMKSDSCLDKFSCEAGQLTNRLGKAVHPLIEILEPFIPAYMSNKFTAFKIGARSGGSDCSQFQCRVPFFGN